MSFRFIDLFAGIGGFRLGFEAAGGRCVFTSEIDRHARQVYACNHGGDESAIAGDISEITATDIPEHDMLLAGFPCQAFSIGGQRRGFDDTRGTLFFEIARVLAAGRTKAFCLENVPHLLKHDSGKTFSVITGTLRDLGFHLSFQVVNAAAWVPQKRKRLFLCGHKTNRAFNIDFMPVPNPADGPRLCSILEPHPPQDATLEDAEWKAALEHKARQEAQGRGFGCNIVDPDSVAPTLTARYIANNTILLNPDIEAATLSSATWDALRKHRAKHKAAGKRIWVCDRVGNRCGKHPVCPLWQGWFRNPD